MTAFNKFYVWCPDRGGEPEEARAFQAFDAEHAASEWAHWDDSYSSDYSIVGGIDARVCVREEGSDDVREFLIQGRTERVYDTHEISKDDA